MNKVLTIAGSDCSGGAGIQADLKTITAHGQYGMSVITALTAQNTLGVSGIYEVSPQFVGEQLSLVCEDIFPDAVKIGMLHSAEIMKTLCRKIKEYRLRNIVLDPVMISTSGKSLLKEEAVYTLIEELLPLADVFTPNLYEASAVSGICIRKKSDMLIAAQKIGNRYEGYILLKGGHLKDCSDDLLYKGGVGYWYRQERINNQNTHGTGCTLSTAIACNLAKGKEIKDSIAVAKEYVTGAIKANLKLGQGNGPLNHVWNIQV
jgi:hydroxymethylpyrimidine/phosphomethylpyrimidine kinase